ncbi:MAG TPA: DUF1080 domain-containing protein [Humisphaera sp.]|jgi:hypothetical protein|nr:DUF1080 domain-containing protein [Humisphaera sp.]
MIVGLAGALRAADEADQGELLFNGKDFTGWKFSNKQTEVWKVVSTAKYDEKDPNQLQTTGDGSDGKGLMFRLQHEEGYGANPFTEKKFGDCQVHVEFMIPKKANSGVYLMGQYEVQILSDYDTNNLGMHNTGAIYVTHVPLAKALKPYGEWNTYDIVFRAPRFDADGKKTENAKFISVILNGIKIQENVDTPKPTGGQLPGGEQATGPLMLQGDHGCVAFRNVRVKSLNIK